MAWATPHLKGVTLGTRMPKELKLFPVTGTAPFRRVANVPTIVRATGKPSAFWGPPDQAPGPRSQPQHTTKLEYSLANRFRIFSVLWEVQRIPVKNTTNLSYNLSADTFANVKVHVLLNSWCTVGCAKDPSLFAI